MPAELRKLEPEREGDNVARPTQVAGEFFSECHPASLALGGAEKTFPIGTFVTVAGRLNGRVLLKTDDNYYRWSAIDFIFKSKS